MTSEWLRGLAVPVLKDDYGLILPLYRRYRYDGTLTQALVVPLMRSLFGRQLAHPLAEEFACSAAAADYFLEQPIWDSELGRQGLEFWLPAAAIEHGLPIGQSVLGARTVAPSAAAARAARPHGGPRGGRALRAGRPHRELLARHPRLGAGGELRGAARAACPAGRPVDPSLMQVGFVQGVRDLLPVWERILAPENLGEVLELSDRPLERFRFPDRLWTRVVYDFVLAYRTRVVYRSHAAQSLAPLYLGRAASVVLETHAKPPLRRAAGRGAPGRHVRGGEALPGGPLAMKPERHPVVIEHVRPAVDDGRHPVKRVVGDVLTVTADIFKEGHDQLAARVRYRGHDAAEWREAPMRLVDNDGWAGQVRSTPTPATSTRWRRGPTPSARGWRRCAGASTRRPDRPGERAARGRGDGPRRPRGPAAAPPPAPTRPCSAARSIGSAAALPRRPPRRAARRRAPPGDGAGGAAADLTPYDRCWTWWSIGREAALRVVVRVVPALQGRVARPARHLRRLHRAAARHRSAWASTSSTCRPSTPSAAPRARARTTRSPPGPATRAAPGPSAGRRAATRRCIPSSARSRTSAAS